MTHEMIVAQDTNVKQYKVFDESIVNRFIKFAGVSEKSAKTYMIALKQMFRYLQVKAIVRPTREDMENWRDELIANKKSASTVQLYITSAKLFYRWLAQEKLYDNVTDHMKAKVKQSHEHKKDALSTTQSRSLLQSVTGDSLKALRDRAILALMLTAGLRTIEIVRADYEDIRKINGGIYLFVCGKGHYAKDQSVLIAEQVKVYIDEYITARQAAGEKIETNTPLFISHANRNKGKRLQTQTVSKMVKAHLRKIGLDTPKLTAHSLRHTAATSMIIAGVDLPKVQMVLRHVSISTTMIYNNAVERMKNTAEQTAANVLFGS